MNKEKQVYLSPETETLVIQVEGVVCTSGEFNPNQWNPGNEDWFVNP